MKFLICYFLVLWGFESWASYTGPHASLLFAFSAFGPAFVLRLFWELLTIADSLDPQDPDMRGGR